MVIPTILEAPEGTWEKRYKQRHYSYRDFHQSTTQVLTQTQVNMLIAQALAANQLPPATIFYRFGDNARADALMNLLGTNFASYLWPRTGDPFEAGLTAGCFAREVLVTSDQDVWIRLVSLNPEYLRQAVLKETGALKVITAPMLLFENERLVSAGDAKTYYPTYGYGIVFRADSVQGTIEIDVEGNVEGTE
jgi:hypothetical protein